MTFACLSCSPMPSKPESSCGRSLSAKKFASLWRSRPTWAGNTAWCTWAGVSARLNWPSCQCRKTFAPLVIEKECDWLEDGKFCPVFTASCLKTKSKTKTNVFTACQLYFSFWPCGQMQIVLCNVFKKKKKVFSALIFFLWHSIADTSGENIAESLVNEGLATVRREGIRGNK